MRHSNDMKKMMIQRLKVSKSVFNNVLFEAFLLKIFLGETFIKCFFKKHNKRFFSRISDFSKF